LTSTQFDRFTLEISGESLGATSAPLAVPRVSRRGLARVCV
jgi:hypothetical protein